MRQQTNKMPIDIRKDKNEFHYLLWSDGDLLKLEATMLELMDRIQVLELTIKELIAEK